MQLARSPFLFLMVALPTAGSTIAADRFTRGDVDQSGRIGIVDAIYILEALFGGGNAIACEDAADVDDNGSLTLADPIFLLESLFRGGLAPVAPFPVCGDDPTSDGLSCEAFECRFAFRFFGQPLSADAVFFVVDKSSVMADSGALQRAKGETLRVLNALPDGVRFAVVFFAFDVTRFPAVAEPAIASEETRASARSFVDNMPGSAGTCGGAALISALESASLSGPGRKLILYVSDGAGTCVGQGAEEDYLQRTLEDVTAFNFGLANINTFQVLHTVSVGESFLRDLAERNGGTYVASPTAERR